MVGPIQKVRPTKILLTTGIKKNVEVVIKYHEHNNNNNKQIELVSPGCFKTLRLGHMNSGTQRDFMGPA